MTQSLNDSTSTVWNRANIDLDVSEFVGRLFFEVSPFDMGEAAVDPSTYDLFLGIDDITLTFCLPCDYDLLRINESLVLSGPSDFTVRLRITSRMQYNGSSSFCPDQQLEYNIDSGEGWYNLQ